MGKLNKKLAELSEAIRLRNLPRAAKIAGSIQEILNSLPRDITIDNESLNGLMDSIVGLGSPVVD